MAQAASIDTTLSDRIGTGREPLTMSTLEIAELTGKEHRNVMRDARKMLAELHGEGVLKFEHTHLNTQNGQSYPVFRLPKRETLVLVSGYSVEMRARIIDRWLELEAELAARPTLDPGTVLADPAAVLDLVLACTRNLLALEARMEAQGVQGPAPSIASRADVDGTGPRDLPALADGRLWGTGVAKVNAAARMLSAANALYGPEAARMLWEMEPGLPRIGHVRPGLLAGTAQDDPAGCFRHLTRQAAAPGRTVGHLLHLALSDRLAERMLPDFGLRLRAQKAPGMLAIANAHPFLAACYAQTQWIGAWRVALAQLPGATVSAGPITFGGTQSRAVLIPRREVIDLLHGVASAC